MINTSLVLSVGSILLMSLMLYSFLFKKKYIKYLNFQILIYIILMTFFISLRDLTGSDTIIYIEYFHYYDDFSSVYDSYFSWKGDYFFFFLGWFIKLFTSSEFIYIFVLDFIGIFLLAFGFYRLSKLSFLNNNLFFIIMFFVFSTSSFIFLYGNVIRQGIAISLIIVSLSYFLDKRKFLGIIYFLLAIFTHKSSLIFLPVFLPVLYFNIKWRTIIFIFIVSFLVGKLQLITKIADFNILFVSDKILSYQNAEQMNLNLKLIILMINTIIFSLFINKNIIFDKILKIWILLFSVVLFSIEIEKFASRLILYNDILTPLLYGMILFISRKEKYFSILLISEFLFIMIYSFYVYNHPSITNTIHYSNTLF